MQLLEEIVAEMNTLLQVRFHATIPYGMDHDTAGKVLTEVTQGAISKSRAYSLCKAAMDRDTKGGLAIGHVQTLTSFGVLDAYIWLSRLRNHEKGRWTNLGICAAKLKEQDNG